VSWLTFEIYWVAIRISMGLARIFMVRLVRHRVLL
jgi:hypothetical protein